MAPLIVIQTPLTVVRYVTDCATISCHIVRLDGIVPQPHNLFNGVANLRAVLKLVEWTPRTPIFYGWVVLGMAALGTYAATGVAQVVIGGIQNLIFEDLGWDRSTVAFAVTAGTWMSGLLAPIFGRLVDQHGPRRLMPPAALIAGVSFIALAGIREVWHFYAAYMIARAIANPALVGVVPRTVAVNFFHRKRNLAIGLVSTFRPVSGAINIQIISVIAAASSWRVAYRLLGVFSILLVLPLFLIMRKRPEDIGLRPDGDESAASLRAATSTASGRDRPSSSDDDSWSAGEALATSAFWLIVLAEMLTILTSSTVGFQMVPFLVDSGISQPIAVIALSLSSMLGALVNPFWGVLADRYQPRVLATLATAATLVTAACFIPTGGGTGGFVVAIVWGIASGGLNVLGSMMLAQYFGRASYGTITGLTGPFQMAFLGLGPTMGALLFRATDGYTVIWYYALGAYAIATVLIFSARRPMKKRRE